MILVRHNGTGDTAEAPCPESALLAARTLRDDSLLNGLPLVRATVSFYVDGRLVREVDIQGLG